MGEKDRDGTSGRKLRRQKEHVVFDFTGLARPGVEDLALILTARLQSAPSDPVWVRSLPQETARILSALGLGHLFRLYPKGSDQLH
jgi:hypothetical protein